MKSNKAYIWQGNLKRISSPQNNYFWSLLAPDEKVRANRFNFEAHRRRFIIARGTLRHLAGQLLNQAPEKLQLSYSNHGKPIFKNYPHVQFNLSHSQDWVIYVFALHTLVGVDIEYKKPHRNIEGIARRFFTRHEYATLQKLTSTEKVNAFFKLWVSKEAVLKALGMVLSARALTQIEFDLDQDSIYLSARGNDELNPAQWSLYTFNHREHAPARLPKQQVHRQCRDQCEWLGSPSHSHGDSNPAVILNAQKGKGPQCLSIENALAQDFAAALAIQAPPHSIEIRIMDVLPHTS